jgi:hypothetical protein
MSGSVPAHRLLSLVLAHFPFLCGAGRRSKHRESPQAGLYEFRTLVGARFFAQSITALGPIHGESGRGRGFNNSPPSSVEVKESVSAVTLVPHGM